MGFAHPAPASDSSSPAQVALAAIAAFMQRTGISVRGLRCDPTGLVDQRVREVVKTWEIDDSCSKQFYAILTAGVDIASSAYAHTPLETQVHIAIYTLLTICVDDFLMDTVAMEEFTARLRTGSPQGHPLLQYLADNLSAMTDYFLPFASKAIITSTIAFVNHTLFDKLSEDMVIHQAALNYVEYKRVKNGIADVYSFFIWDKHTFPDMLSYIQSVPETMIYLNYVNDIFSFYKEEIAGDVHNYVHDRARVTNKTAQAALLDVVNDVVSAVERARAIIQNDAQKVALEHFFVGYAVYHFCSPRYRLLDLTGTDYV